IAAWFHSNRYVKTMGHALMQGPPLKLQLARYDVRPATAAEMDACNALCRRVHGFDAAPNSGMQSYKRAPGWCSISGALPAMQQTSAFSPTRSGRATRI